MNAVVQQKPRLPGLLSIFLVVVLGISLAKLMWLVLSPKPKIHTDFAVTDSTESSQKAKINYGKLIADQHLFGVVKKAPVVKQAPPKKEVKVVAPTRLNLKLQGIVAYKSNDKSGFALISVNNGPQKVFGKGDAVDKGVYVKDIQPGKVILDNNGTTEELTLPVKELDKPAAKQRSVSSRLTFGGRPVNSNQADTKRRNKQPQSRNPTASHANNAGDDLPDLGKYRQEVIESPQKLLQIATPSPAIINGQFIGFRVKPGPERRLFKSLGFRSGDIITEVNGIILDDASKGAMVLGELTQAADLSIKVKRGNSEVMIEHTF